MTEAEILAAVRGLIDDPDGDFCPAPELSFHLGEVALDFSRRSKAVRKSKTQSIPADTTNHTLPDDCLDIRKITRSDGTEVVLMTSVGLDGDALDDTGTYADAYVRDLNGYNTIRLYPIPTSSDTFTLYYSAFTRDSQVIPHLYHGTLVWGASAKALAKSTNPGDQPKMAQFAAAYEAGLQVAAADVGRNFSSKSRTIPYRHF